MGALTLRTSGSTVSAPTAAAITPSAGTHGADYQTGDLMLCVAICRAGAESITALTGWTQLLAYTTQGSIEVWARIADGGANDSPSVDWSGSSQVAAWIDVFYGDVYTTLASIVHAYNVESASSSSVPRCPALSNAANSFTANNCLLYAVGKRSTVADTVASVLAPTGLTLAHSFIDNSFGFAVGSAYVQQTTQTDFGGTDFSLTGAGESSSANGVILALMTETTADRYVKLLSPAAAASASSIEGVVLNAARDTVIGEFTGQAYEASLESGEAVLLIPVEDIVPDGPTLDLSDTPLVIAYNSGYSTDLASATVVEV